MHEDYQARFEEQQLMHERWRNESQRQQEQQDMQFQRQEERYRANQLEHTRSQQLQNLLQEELCMAKQALAEATAVSLVSPTSGHGFTPAPYAPQASQQTPAASSPIPGPFF